jgi:hypothetical protein
MAGSTGFTRRWLRDAVSSGRVWIRWLAAAAAITVTLRSAGVLRVEAADGVLDGVPAEAQVLPVARAFQAAVLAHDGGGLIGLFAAEAVVKERNAVVAAGPNRVAAWIGACLTTDFALEPDSLVLTADSVASAAAATWAFADSTGCYWRLRPGAETAPWPGPEVNPADGHITISVAQGRIRSLTLIYSDAWQARYLRSVAAPIVAAQARVTATAAAAGQQAAAATEAARAAAASAPHPLNTQGRTTPSVGPWLAALGLLGLAAVVAAGRSPSH